MSKLLTGVFMIGLLLLCQVSMSHAGNIFMLLPGVQGESLEKAHLGWIEVQSATWRHGEAPPGSPIKTQFGRVDISKFSDSTSALLALSAANGKAFPEVKLEIIRIMSGGGSLVLSRMKLTNARVTSYAAAAGEGDLTTEQITFSFDTITWINFKIDNNKGQQLPGSAACWDVVGNKPCTPGF